MRMILPRGLFDRSKRIAEAESRMAAIRERIDENRRTARESWESRVAADREAEAIRTAPWDEFLRRSAAIQVRR